MSDNSIGNKRIAKNTVFLYARMLIVLFVSIYTTRVVLNVLGVVDYGIYNVVCGFVTMFAFFNTTMSNGIQRFYNYESGKGSLEGITRVFRTSVLIQVCLALLLLIVLEFVGIWYVNNKMVIPNDRLIAANWIFQFSTVSLVLLILQIPYSASIIAHEKMDYYALVSIVDVILKLAIVIALPYIPGDKLLYYGVLLLIISIVNFIMNYLYAKIKFKELSFKLEYHKDTFKSIVSFSGWNLIEMFAWMTQNQGVNMVMNLFFGPTINASRGIAIQVQNAIQSFCANLVTAFRPQLIESYAQKDYDRTKSMMFSMSKIMFIFFFALSTPFIFEMDFVFGIWLKGTIPAYSTTFAVLMLVSMYPRNFVAAFSQVIHASGVMRTYQLWSAFIIAGVLPLSYIVMKMGGDPTSAYWVNLLFCIILFVVCMRLLKNVFPYSIVEYLRMVTLPCLVIAIIVCSLLFLLRTLLHDGWMRLLLICFASTITTLLCSYYVGLNKQEKLFIKQIINHRIHK